MGCAFYWASNDGMSGHVWLSDGDLRALTDEMLVQGMPWPAERIGDEASIDPDELEAVLDPASPNGSRHPSSITTEDPSETRHTTNAT